jgi:zinc protease
MIVSPNFDKNEIEKEKQVIIQELKMNQDNPHKVLLNKFLEFYYGNNPYGWPVI